jgi:hypothetical protein
MPHITRPLGFREITRDRNNQFGLAWGPVPNRIVHGWRAGFQLTWTQGLARLRDDAPLARKTTTMGKCYMKRENGITKGGKTGGFVEMNSQEPWPNRPIFLNPDEIQCFFTYWMKKHCALVFVFKSRYHERLRVPSSITTSDERMRGASLQLSSGPRLGASGELRTSFLHHRFRD